MYEDDLDNLSYHDDDSSPPMNKDLLKGSKRLLKRLLSFAEHRYNIGSPIFDDWSQVTEY